MSRPGRQLNWPGRQQWALNRTAKRLRADDPRLGSLFAYFTGLTRGEAMPTAERIENRLRPKPRPAPARRGGRHRTIAAFFIRVIPGISGHIAKTRPGAYTHK